MTLRRLAAVLFFALAALSPIWSDAILEFSFSPGLDTADSILQSLAEGHRSDVHYEARVYRRITGVSRIFGDRLIAETTVEYQARWDELNKRYVVLIDSERERSFDSSDALLEFLLALNNHHIHVPEEDGEDLYLVCRAQIEPIHLVPPLTLMTFLMPRFRTTTPWVETGYRWYDQ